MNKKALYALGVVAILVFGGYSFTAFQASLTPYVSYQEARSSAGGTVQVAGALGEGTTGYDEASQTLHFTLVEEGTGETLKIRYGGVRPANFEDAVSIVAIGSWDGAGGELAADKLLVKCPSKYQGLESEEDAGAYETKEYG